MITANSSSHSSLNIIVSGILGTTKVLKELAASFPKSTQIFDPLGALVHLFH